MTSQIIENAQHKKAYSKPEVSEIGHISSLINGGGPLTPTDGVTIITGGGNKLTLHAADMS